MKKILLLSIIVSFLIKGGYYFGCIPFVLQWGDVDEVTLPQQLDTGNFYQVIISLSFEDYYSTDLNLCSSLLSCEDTSIVSMILNNCISNEENGDMSSASSILYILENDQLIFKSKFVLDNTLIGIQSDVYGWVELPRSLMQNFSESYLPIVIL